MDPHGNPRNQRGTTNIRRNEEEPEEKVPYGLGIASTPPYLNQNPVNNSIIMTQQDLLQQQRLLDRLQAEERQKLRQQNQQLMQLAQNQARRQQVLQQQIRQAVTGGSGTTDPFHSDLPSMLDNTANNSPLMLPSSVQQRRRQIEYYRTRRERLMQLHLLREQRLRREEELLEAMIRDEQRQASLAGLDTGCIDLMPTTSSMRLRPSPSDSGLLSPALNFSNGIRSGAATTHMDPELALTNELMEDERQLMNRLLQSQQQLHPTTADNLDATLSRIENIDTHPFEAQINTAPASFQSFDVSRLDPPVGSSNQQLLSSRRQQYAWMGQQANMMDSLLGQPQPWLTQPVGASGRYPTTTEIIGSSPSKSNQDDKNKPSVEKKKAVSRKKIAGMPKRPLHAYNIYFQEERQKILKEIPSPPENEDDNAKKLTPGARRKRRRRGTHGKITFASLAKEIGYKWHQLDKEKKEHYQQLAEIELKRYDDEMDAYNLKQKLKEKTERDEVLLDQKPKAKALPSASSATAVKEDDDDFDDEEEEDDDEDDDDDNNEAQEVEEEDDSLSVTAVSAKKSKS